jgi:hypothetical protein
LNHFFSQSLELKDSEKDKEDNEEPDILGRNIESTEDVSNL